MTSRRIRPALALGVLAVLAAAPASAHHPMGGTTPTTLAQGLLSGFAHPVIGLDHLAFVIAAGVLAAPLAGRHLLPAAFVATAVLAALLHVGGFDLPGAEIGVALSVVVLGAILVLGRTLSALPLAGLFALAGLLHGYALAETVAGAEPTPITAYLVGFGAVQYVIALGAMEAVRHVAPARLGLARAGIGAAAILVGLVQFGLVVA